MKKKFTVHFSFYFSDAIDLEAENEKEAEALCRQLIESEQIGDVTKMELGEQKVWVD